MAHFSYHVTPKGPLHSATMAPFSQNTPHCSRSSGNSFSSFTQLGYDASFFYNGACHKQSIPVTRHKIWNSRNRSIDQPEGEQKNNGQRVLLSTCPGNLCCTSLATVFLRPVLSLRLAQKANNGAPRRRENTRTHKQITHSPVKYAFPLFTASATVRLARETKNCIKIATKSASSACSSSSRDTRKKKNRGMHHLHTVETIDLDK